MPARKKRATKKKAAKTTGRIHSCAVTLGRKGGQATAKKRRAKKKASKKPARKR